MSSSGTECLHENLRKPWKWCAISNLNRWALPKSENTWAKLWTTHKELHFVVKSNLLVLLSQKNKKNEKAKAQEIGSIIKYTSTARRVHLRQAMDLKPRLYHIQWAQKSSCYCTWNYQHRYSVKWIGPRNGQNITQIAKRKRTGSGAGGGVVYDIFGAAAIAHGGCRHPEEFISPIRTQNGKTDKSFQDPTYICVV